MARAARVLEHDGVAPWKPNKPCFHLDYSTNGQCRLVKKWRLPTDLSARTAY